MNEYPIGDRDYLRPIRQITHSIYTYPKKQMKVKSEVNIKELVRRGFILHLKEFVKSYARLSTIHTQTFTKAYL